VSLYRSGRPSRAGEDHRRRLQGCPRTRIGAGAHRRCAGASQGFGTDRTRAAPRSGRGSRQADWAQQRSQL